MHLEDIAASVQQLGKDAQDLIDRVVENTERPTVFLIGSALTMQPSPGEPGVPDVRGIVEKLRASLKRKDGDVFDEAYSRAQASNLAKDFAAAYRAGFSALFRRGGGQDVANRIIREAVLEAHNDLDITRRSQVLRVHSEEHKEICQEPRTAWRRGRSRGVCAWILVRF